MKRFEGFPARMSLVPVPDLAFSSLLPRIKDLTELKTLLHIFALLYARRGKLRFVTGGELLERMSAVGDLRESQQSDLRRALALLVEEGIILHLPVQYNWKSEDAYFLNSAANRQTVEAVRSGEVVLPEMKPTVSRPAQVSEPANVFTVYEQNIGLLTPLIAEEIKDAIQQYPEVWIRDAVKEATAENKRNWRYISSILARWAAQGKDNGAHRGNLKTHADPDKYIRGKYGHMVQR